jgi:pyruvate/2-oxoacid:ferredoxin oxidoreductase alpha subunit/NAD-dependent dihydropyrimidine dehydrogenase PreA subunit
VPRERAVPELHPEFCKGCFRCVAACALGCLKEGGELHAVSGMTPVALELAGCTGCGLCVDACPEPHGLVRAAAEPLEARLLPPGAADVPDTRLPLPPVRPALMKGTHASAVGALLAGCRHFFGYPITPSTEGAELMARLLPAVGGTFVQAASELAAVNMMYGCGGAGLRTMTFTSSPGFSLMLEGISYMIGAEIPAVFVNVMRAGPGLGNIGPEQSDVKLACRGLGHGNTHAPVLAPATPQEMLELTMLAFDLAFQYRTPVVVLADGHLGQMSGRVALPQAQVRPGLPGWAVWGDAGHRRNVHSSIHLREADQEAHNLRLIEKYERISAAEQRAAYYRCHDAELLLVACNTPAQAARGAVETLRAEGIPVGLFRPQTLWPFPTRLLLPLLDNVWHILVVEASDGQLEDELRVALSHAGAGADVQIGHLRRHGGILPSQREIVDAVRALRARQAVAA